MSKKGKTTKSKDQIPAQKPARNVSKASLKRMFPIVGVGASAGGLEAFSQLLSNLPERTGMAYVLVQHLDPRHASGLTEILSRTTRLPVVEVTNGLRVKPDSVYVIPPDMNMTIEDGTLRLSARTFTRGQHMPIDLFFNSLAEQRKHNAIGVVLSGTASDGTEGCRAIKSAGGITFAQDEASAKYTSMPRSAVLADSIDFVLSPKEIARELARIGQHPYTSVPELAAAPALASASDAEQLKRIYEILWRNSQVDFTHYKPSTLHRRIRRRMVLLKVNDLKEFADLLQENPDEAEKLYRDILIHVTGFFREPRMFEGLKKTVFPRLFEDRKADQPIRIWVPGCSTGEEAYSLAIALLEFLEDRGKRFDLASTKPLQIFATDISEFALEKGRAGIYPDSISSDVSQDRLRHYFVKLPNGAYQIQKTIREMCIFVRQNVATDPPFSNLDLISCRNLLIYLGQPLQKRVIPIFHYALRPKGYLVLGSSETLGPYAEHFSLIDKKHKIYAKKMTSMRPPVTFAQGVYPALHDGSDASAQRGTTGLVAFEKDAERILQSRYLPPSIVVNQQMEIVHIKGRVGAYLEPASGRPTFNLTQMAREGLLVDLRAMIAKAKKENGAVKRRGVRFQSNGDIRFVNIDVVPFSPEGTNERYSLIIFQTARGPEADGATTHDDSHAKARSKKEQREVTRLKQEVASLREQLRNLIEEHETTTEEFRSANEEVLSANEELQSTNEELETAKEELQSSNEELTTLNEELHNRNAELSVANNDLHNLFENVSIPLVIVDGGMKIRRFTPPSQKLLNLNPSDTGRRLGMIRPNIKGDDLEPFVQKCIDSIQAQEREMQDNAGLWYMMRVRPYRTWENKIDGAVMSFQDISAMKHTVDQERQFTSAVLETAREGILILDGKLRVLKANPAFCRTFRVSAEDTLGNFLHELGSGQWNIPELRRLLDQVLPKQSRVEDFEVEKEFPGIGRRIMLLNARRIVREADRPVILLVVQDITERRRTEEAIYQAQEEERRRIAHNLHESTGQRLTALQLNLNLLGKKLGDRSPATQKLIGESISTAKNAAEEIRTLSYLLYPPLLENMGLIPALRDYTDELKARSGLKLDVDLPGQDDRLSHEDELALFRAAQEGLSNVVRHSGSKNASVKLTRTNGEVRLEVSDSGHPDRRKRGSFGAETPPFGVGLTAIRRRLEQLGGRLDIQFSKNGTTLTAVLSRRAVSAT